MFPSITLKFKETVNGCCNNDFWRYDRDDFDTKRPSSYGVGRILNHTHNFTIITLCVHMGHMKLDEFKHS
jgi:hypothetical protein